MANRALQVRLDPAIRSQAETILAGLGMSMSDAVRMFVTRIAHDKQLPIELFRPNAETRAAMAELEAGGGGTAHSVDDLMAQLHAND